MMRSVTFKPETIEEIQKIATRLADLDALRTQRYSEITITPMFTVDREPEFAQRSYVELPDIWQLTKEIEKGNREILNLFATFFKDMGMVKEWSAITLAIRIMAEWNEIIAPPDAG